MPSYKILDAGDRILFSGSDKAEVEAALRRFLDRGSKLLSPVSKVGGSWVGSCGQPTKPHAADQTTTLNLSDFNLPPRQKKPPPGDRGCTIEEFGLKRLISGPSQHAVRLKVEDFTDLGATLDGDIEEQDGGWTALVDTAAMKPPE